MFLSMNFRESKKSSRYEQSINRGLTPHIVNIGLTALEAHAQKGND